MCGTGVVGGDLLLALLQFRHLLPVRVCVVYKSVKQRELHHVLRLVLSLLSGLVVTVPGRRGQRAAVLWLVVGVCFHGCFSCDL